MLEVAYKVVGYIILERLRPIKESPDHESQCGFRPWRGATDAIWNLKMAVRKRREHGLETWILFIDIIKAFDTVYRVMLWMVLAKFGVPCGLVRKIKALHERVNVKFEVDGVTREMGSIIGVKQGGYWGLPFLYSFKRP